MVALNEIFRVTSTADLGLQSYYLDESGFHHIITGHRDLRNVILTAVQNTVEEPTHVYRSTYDVRRYQFFSTNNTTSNGHSMNVIIQVEGVIGRVVTASPKTRVKGELVWDTVTGLYASFDKQSDILYISIGGSGTSFADDDPKDERIWLRYFEDNKSPSGVTIFDASTLWQEDPNRLMAHVSDFLDVSKSELEDRVTKFFLN
jgi:uncharacterized protein YuzE